MKISYVASVPGNQFEDGEMNEMTLSSRAIILVEDTIYIVRHSANTKHLYYICTMLDHYICTMLDQRRWVNTVHIMLNLYNAGPFHLYNVGPTSLV